MKQWADTGKMQQGRKVNTSITTGQQEGGRGGGEGIVTGGGGRVRKGDVTGGGGMDTSRHSLLKTI